MNKLSNIAQPMIPSKLTINFRFGLYNGSMSLRISDKDKELFYLSSTDKELVCAEFPLELPNILVFEIEGKNPKTDTKLSSDGQVIADKFIQIQSMSLDLIPVSEQLLFKILKYTPANQDTTFNTYWAFNGVAELDFNEQTAVRWHLRNNNVFNLNV